MGKSVWENCVGQQYGITAWDGNMGILCVATVLGYCAGKIRLGMLSSSLFQKPYIRVRQPYIRKYRNSPPVVWLHLHIHDVTLA
jgi:hypothetical protein